MDIEVKHNDKFAELIITEGNASIQTGLLDAKEARAQIQELVNAASTLAYHFKYQFHNGESLDKILDLAVGMADEIRC